MAKDLLAVWEEITIEYPFFSAYIFSCLIQLHSFVYAYVFANNPYCFIECYVGNFTCKVVRLIIFNNPFNDRRQWNFRPCVAFLWHIGQSFACSYMDNMFMYLGYFAKKAAFNVVFMISCSLRSNLLVRWLARFCVAFIFLGIFVEFGIIRYYVYQTILFPFLLTFCLFFSLWFRILSN